MCGVFAFLDIQRNAGEYRDRALRQARLLRHRGPDWSGIWEYDRAVLAHERLAIVDVLRGAQPIVGDGGRYALAVNGEIYNHRRLQAEVAEFERGQGGAPWEYATESDCEVILPLYHRHGPRFLNRLRGMFAFVLVDKERDEWVIARDPIGIIPLYVGRDDSGTLVVSSELKGLLGVCKSVWEFPPGHVQTSADDEPIRYYEPSWTDFDAIPDVQTDPSAIRDSLSESVHVHLMSDVPYGVLLSGGLDSSIISAIAARMAGRRVETDDIEPAWWPRLHSFSIGLEGSPDLIAAQKVADAIGTAHHGFTFTIQEGLDALRDVVWHTETFDVTTIRASTPMYLMARRIRAMGVKMVLSGEGADEIFGGYLYFHKAPNAREFHAETVRKLTQLHQFDCLRANKSMAAFGVEARVPFLDREFIDVAMSVHPRDKMCGDRIEKSILRSAFDGWLPNEILWRQKEQFSDGVGYSWIDTLRALGEDRVSDRQMAEAGERFPIGTPASKEGYLYRQLFDELFPLPSAAACVPVGPSIACSTPTALRWDAQFAESADPSGRAVRDVHAAGHQSEVAGPG